VKELRPYQSGCVADAYRAWSSGILRVLVCSATGTGKTHIIGRIVQDFVIKRGRPVLIVAYRLTLVDQMVAKLEEEFDVPCGVIKEGERFHPERLCQVASIKTLLLGTLPPAELLVIDETHRTDADEVVALYPKTRLLGATATPIMYSRGKELTLHGKYDVMVKPNITRAQLVADGFLSPIRIIAPELPDLSDIPTAMGEFQSRKLSDFMGQPRLVGDAVTHWKLHASDRPTFTFCVDLAHCAKLKAAFESGGVPAVILSSRVDNDDRRPVLNRLAAREIPMVLSVDVLGVGVDVPEVACVDMQRPTQSEVTFLQQIGRGIRGLPWKKDCLVLDHAGNVARHGDPSRERDPPYSLDANVKPRRINELPEIPMWRCMSCFSMIQGRRIRTCPYCKAEGSATVRKIRLTDGKLVEYDEEMFDALEKQRREREFAEGLLKTERGRRFKRLFGVAKRRGIPKAGINSWIFTQLHVADRSGLDFDQFVSQL
jgi:superfamily II DNA or RNA helicase